MYKNISFKNTLRIVEKIISKNTFLGVYSRNKHNLFRCPRNNANFIQSENSGNEKQKGTS